MKADSALDNNCNYDCHLAEEQSKLIMINSKLAQQEANEQIESWFENISDSAAKCDRFQALLRWIFSSEVATESYLFSYSFQIKNTQIYAKYANTIITR